MMADWYKNVSRNLDKLQLSCEQWMESLESLVRVTVEVSKNRPGLHQLCISLRQIHQDYINSAFPCVRYTRSSLQVR